MTGGGFFERMDNWGMINGGRMEFGNPKKIWLCPSVIEIRTLTIFVLTPCSYQHSYRPCIVIETKNYYQS